MSVLHRFSVQVNCFLPDDDLVTDAPQDSLQLYEDHGVLLLPDTYSETGPATRLIISCHGAGGIVGDSDSQMEQTAFAQYLAANGYAVMDVNGLPHAYADEKGIDLRNNIGSPIALRSYVKAYHYCMEHFNLNPEVFVHGSSMGGISSTNLVLSGMIPVIAHTAFCPVLDAYHQIYLHPWEGGVPREALGKIYNLSKDDNGEYVYDAKKLIGFNPAASKKAAVYPVPLKFWHCMDDTVVSYEVTQRFVNTVREHGGIATLRTFTHGGHEPQLLGEPVKKPSGRSLWDGNPIDIRTAVEEAFIWIENFN